MTKTSSPTSKTRTPAAKKRAATGRAAKPAASRRAADKPAASRLQAKKTAPAKRNAAKPPRSGRAAPKPAARKKTAGSRSTAATAARVAQDLVTATRANLASAATGVARVVGTAVSSIGERVSRGNGSPDALEMLEQDHRRLEALLKQGEATSARGAKTRTELLDTITAELNAHELIEERVLYPALKAHPKARDIVLEGYQEHHVADLIVKELHGLARSDERWGAKFKVLKENIEHHIEEEEGKMFAAARSILSGEEREALANEMRRLKARSA